MADETRGPVQASVVQAVLSPTPARNQQPKGAQVPQEPGPTLLFVYGTLKHGKPLHSVLTETARFIGEARATGFTLFTNNGYYPFLSPARNGRAVGEVYIVDAATLEECDQIEVGAGYQRVRIHVQPVQGGDPLPVVAYLGPDEWRRTARLVGDEWGAW